VTERDLGFAEPLLPGIAGLVRRYFHTSVKGLERIPADQPVLFVANHSGGTPSPDSVAFILSYIDRFGIDKPLYWLGHSLVMSAPGLGRFLRRCGVLPASPGVARSVLDRGGSLVVYPGGEVELHRPWTARNEIRFLGHTGFVRLAMEAGVPIVPVVSAGGHNTYLPLTDGRGLARRLGLDRRFNLKVLPISLAVPWGVNIGDFLLHVPLPAHISIEVLDPIDVRAEFGDDVDAAYRRVVRLMQRKLDEMSSPRP
jgi:1-acyl-sn-glycerol-3-phosphate acyltransferase